MLTYSEQCSRAAVCSVVEDGVAVVFGPRAPSSVGIVQSVCETLELPNVRIYPEASNVHIHPDMPEYQRRCHINLYPAQESVAQVGWTEPDCNLMALLKEPTSAALHRSDHRG